MDPTNAVTGGFVAQAPPTLPNTAAPVVSKKFRNEKKRPTGKKPTPTKDFPQEQIRAHIQTFVAVWTQFSENEKAALTKIFSSNPNTLSAKTHTFVYGSPQKTLADRVTKPAVKNPAQEAERSARKSAKVEKRKTIRAQKNEVRIAAQQIQANAGQVLNAAQPNVLESMNQAPFIEIVKAQEEEDLIDYEE